MSSEASDRPRITIDASGHQRSRFDRFWEALTNRFTQTVETRSKQGRFSIFSSDINRVQPAERLDEYRDIAISVPIVRKGLSDFVSDAIEPGYRIETDDETVKEYLEDIWCPQAAIIGGEKHHDLLPLLRLFLFERWRGGDAMVEHVRDDPDNANSRITGVHLLNPEHIEFITYDDKNILLDPDPVEDLDDVPLTRRGEAAAYIQYGSNAPVRRDDRDEVRLSQNDVTRSSLDPGAGNIRGTPMTQTIATDVAGMVNILRDKEEAIKTKAYGLWELAFDRDILEYTDIDPETGEITEITEIIEWSTEDQDSFVEDNLNEIEPGAILTHDGAISMNRLDGDVPDLTDDLFFYVSNIVAALPTPLYIIGFETNINQFVTERQDARYQQIINEERNELERVFTDLISRVIHRNLVENTHRVDDGRTLSVREVPSDLSFKIEPQSHESPVMSLSEDDIGRMEQWTRAFERLRGDIPPDMLVDVPEVLALILQLPEEVIHDEASILAELDETNEQVQAIADSIMGNGQGDAADAEDVPPEEVTNQ